MDTNKMRDPVREQFEAEFSRQFPTIFAAAKAGEGKAHGDMSVAWWGWQASREAVVVDLPLRGALAASDSPWEVFDACREAVVAQGLKVNL